MLSIQSKTLLQMGLFANENVENMNLKLEKWVKMIIKESKILIQEYLDKADFDNLIILIISAGDKGR